MNIMWKTVEETGFGLYFAWFVCLLSSEEGWDVKFGHVKFKLLYVVYLHGEL